MKMVKRKLDKKKHTQLQSNSSKTTSAIKSSFLTQTDFRLVLAFLGLTLILFHGIFSFNQSIISNDFNLWAAKYTAQHVRAFTWLKWLPYHFAGIDFSGSPIYPTHLLLFFMSPSFWLGFNYALHVFLLGTFMYFWMRYLGLNRFASSFAAVSMMFTNHVVTLVYPGHMGKFETFAWTPLTFLFLTKGVRERKISAFILAGCFFGLQLLGAEFQVAHYLGICLFLYLVYLLFWDYRNNRQIKPLLQSVGGFMIMAIITTILAAQVVLYFLGSMQFAEIAWKTSTKENKSLVTAQQTTIPAANRHDLKPEGDADSGYEFNTSWSFPPEEILTFFMQRPFGDYSGAEGDRAYWGRLGSKNMKIKLSDDYLGIIPIIFAFIAVWFVRKRDILFWVVLGSIALLFSFGGFTPIYRYVLLIPGMNKFRDPNKWIFIVSFCMATLTGYGMNWYSTLQTNTKTQNKDVRVKYLTYILIALCLFCILLTILGVFIKETVVERISSYLTLKGSTIEYSTVLSRYGVILSSFVRMTILLIVGIALIIAGLKVQGKKDQLKYMVIILIAVTAIDLGLSASRFIQYYDDREAYGLDPITAYLKNDPTYYRVKLYSHHPFLQNLTNFKFKYYEIPAWDVAASRLPTLYNNFLMQIADANFGTFLDVGNIKYMLGDRPLNQPAFREVYKASNLYIYQYLGFVPRVFTTSKFTVVKDEDRVIEMMKSPEFNIRNGVIIEEEPSIVSSVTTDYNPVGAEIIQYTPSRVTIRSQTIIPSLLVFHDYYTSNWKAFIDNKSTKVFKTDYLMRSVVVPAGTHTVVFDYQSSMIGLYITAICLILFAGYLLYLGWKAWRSHSNVVDKSKG